MADSTTDQAVFDDNTPKQEETPDQPPARREPKFQFFRYERPEVTAPKGIMKLAQTDLVKGAVQVVRQAARTICIPMPVPIPSGWCSRAAPATTAAPTR